MTLFASFARNCGRGAILMVLLLQNANSKTYILDDPVPLTPYIHEIQNSTTSQSSYVSQKNSIRNAGNRLLRASENNNSWHPARRRSIDDVLNGIMETNVKGGVE